MSRTGPLLRALIPALSVGMIALGLGLARGAESESRAPGPRAEVVAAAGGFREGSNPGGAHFEVESLSPGEKVSGTARVRNSGDEPGLFLLTRSDVSDRPGPHGGRLSERLELTVLDVTKPNAPAVVYTGGIGPLDTRPLGVLRPGASHTYRMTARALPGPTPTVPLGGGDPYQGSSSRLSLRWLAIGGLPSTRLASLLRPVGRSRPRARPVDRTRPRTQPVDRTGPRTQPVDRTRPRTQPVDRTGPRARLVATSQQPVLESGRLTTDLLCGEQCRARGSASMAPDGRRVDAVVAGGRHVFRRRHRLVLGFPPGLREDLRGTLERGRTVEITIRVTATDRARNSSTLRETVRLRPTPR